jgi:epoxide hydrolase-like predicted phosphatase
MENNMPIKAVIWDIGGVINRTEDPTPRDQLATDLGVTRDDLNYLVFESPEGTRAQLGELSVEALWKYVRDELGLTSNIYPDLRERFFGGDILDYQIVDFIRSLRPGYITAVLSNAWDDLREVLNNQWKIADAFDKIIISGEEGVKKPDRRIYEIALDQVGVKPEEVLFVDDFVENIQGARALGITGIQFQNPGQAVGEIKSLLGMKDKG